jgi:hypothetical protein
MRDEVTEQTVIDDLRIKVLTLENEVSDLKLMMTELGLIRGYTRTRLNIDPLQTSLKV